MEYSERHKFIVERAMQAFQKKKDIDQLWQTIAENFFPERGIFTYTPNIGEEFASNLSTSYPIIIRRDLGDSIGGMLRPRGQDWFKVTVNRDPSKIDLAGQAWLENATKAQRMAMYDRPAMFTKATKEGDHDYATFGNAALSVEINLNNNSLLYRCWHLKDLAWCENEYGEIDLVARKWHTTAAEANRYFNGNLHNNILKKSSGKQAYDKCEFLHIVIRAAGYDGPIDPKFDYVSYWFDVENKFLIEEKPRKTSYYIIPRWQLAGNHPYAYSPATIAGLPDARLIQAMTYTLLRAGEKAVDPPLLATQNAINSDVATYPNGITWVDSDYDERLGEVLRPITQDYRALPSAMTMQDKQFEMLMTAFYINKLEMPPVDHEMTAEEARYRVQQYIRQALPLFEPIEQQYNAPLCENTFQLLMMMNTFGPTDSIPESLQNADVEFKFESPLIEARDQELSRTFVDTGALIANALQLDPGAQYVMDVDTALRDAIRGRGAPAVWMRSKEAAKAQQDLAAQKQQEMQQMEQIAAAGQVGQQVGAGLKALSPEEE